MLRKKEQASNSQAKMPLRIWALLGGRAGDNDQVIALAQALGLPFEIKQLEYKPLHVLGPRLLGRSLASLNRRSRAAIFDEPAPDLTISTGHRSVPAVRALKRRSAGRMRAIHVGFPRVSPGHFDLVITTPQYDIADHPKLLRLPYALTRAATKELQLDHRFSLPAPRRLLIAGGPTLFWKLDRKKLLATLSDMIAEARREGGSVLVTTSPRTPAALAIEMAAMLSQSGVATLLSEPGQQPSYLQLLAAATSIRVTADSVSMVSDAIWAGKPLALVPISPSRFGGLVFALHDRVRPHRRIYPQDLRFFWESLADIGLSEQLAVARTSTSRVIDAVKNRSRAIISHSDAVY